MYLQLCIFIFFSVNLFAKSPCDSSGIFLTTLKETYQFRTLHPGTLDEYFKPFCEIINKEKPHFLQALDNKLLKTEEKQAAIIYSLNYLMAQMENGKISLPAENLSTFKDSYYFLSRYMDEISSIPKESFGKNLGEIFEEKRLIPSLPSDLPQRVSTLGSLHEQNFPDFISMHYINLMDETDKSKEFKNLVTNNAFIKSLSSTPPIALETNEITNALKQLSSTSIPKDKLMELIFLTSNYYNPDLLLDINQQDFIIQLFKDPQWSKYQNTLMNLLHEKSDYFEKIFSKNELIGIDEKLIDSYLQNTKFTKKLNNNEWKKNVLIYYIEKNNLYPGFKGFAAEHKKEIVRHMMDNDYVLGTLQKSENIVDHIYLKNLTKDTVAINLNLYLINTLWNAKDLKTYTPYYQSPQYLDKKLTPLQLNFMLPETITDQDYKNSIKYEYEMLLESYLTNSRKFFENSNIQFIHDKIRTSMEFDHIGKVQNTPKIDYMFKEAINYISKHQNPTSIAQKLKFAQYYSFLDTNIKAIQDPKLSYMIEDSKKIFQLIQDKLKLNPTDNILSALKNKMPSAMFPDNITPTEIP